MASSYPFYTPYQFAGNKPIWAADLDGLKEKLFNGSDLEGEAQIAYNALTVKAAITNTIIRLTPWQHKKNLSHEFAKIGITDDVFIRNFQIRMRTIVTNHPADESNPIGTFDIENKFVIENNSSLGQELIEAGLDVLAVTSVMPANNGTGILLSRTPGKFFALEEMRRSVGILFHAKRLSTVGVNNALMGIHKLEDVMEAGMTFVVKNAKKNVYT